MNRLALLQELQRLHRLLPARHCAREPLESPFPFRPGGKFSRIALGSVICAARISACSSMRGRIFQVRRQSHYGESRAIFQKMRRWMLNRLPSS
jgi:hypothetical protein